MKNKTTNNREQLYMSRGQMTKSSNLSLCNMKVHV